MKISELRKRYSALKKVILQISPEFDFAEYDIFMNSLKKFSDLELREISSILEGSNSPIQKKNRENTTESSRKNSAKPQTLDDILETHGLNSIDFNNADLSKIDLLEKQNLLTKDLLMELANKLGITKKVFKTKKEIYQEIRKLIINRDIISNIEDTIKSSVRQDF